MTAKNVRFTLTQMSPLKKFRRRYRHESEQEYQRAKEQSRQDASQNAVMLECHARIFLPKRSMGPESSTGSHSITFETPEVVQVIRQVIQEELVKQDGQASRQQSKERHNARVDTNITSVSSSRSAGSKESHKGSWKSEVPELGRESLNEVLPTVERVLNEDRPAGNSLSRSYIEVQTRYTDGQAETFEEAILRVRRSLAMQSKEMSGRRFSKKEGLMFFICRKVGLLHCITCTLLYMFLNLHTLLVCDTLLVLCC